MFKFWMTNETKLTVDRADQTLNGDLEIVGNIHGMEYSLKKITQKSPNNSTRSL